MRTKLVLVALAAVALSGAPSTGQAHDHRGPEAVLVTDMGEGGGDKYTETWSQRRDDVCTVMVAEDIPRWESPPVRWVPGTEMAVRFDSPHKPSRVRVVAFVFGDPLAGVPLWGGDEVPAELRRVEVDGKKTWEAVLSPPASADLYLDVVAHWKDRGGCGIQESAWTFRAGLLPI